MLERSRIAAQTLPTNANTPVKEVGSLPVTGCFPMGSGDSDEEDLNDPMVSNPICPFVIPVTVQNTHTSLRVKQGALVDSGCTQWSMC